MLTLRRYRPLLLRAVLLASMLAVVAGCGHKGPLYLPDDDETDAERAAARA